MKKIIYILFTLLIALPISVKAATANIKVSSSGSTAVVGSTITVNVTVSSSTPLGAWQFLVNYNTSYLKLVSGDVNVADYVENNKTKSKTYTLKFKALKSGTAQVSIGSYMVYDYDENLMSGNTTKANIKIMTQEELEATYSKDNNLKSLTIDGYTLNPVFDKDNLEYNVSVPSDVVKINISATASDSKSTVSGTGEKEVNEGTNQFSIIVRAQNGAEKTYVLNVEVEDLNPITIKINNQDYTIVKRKENLVKPTTYEETTININNMEIPAFKNDITLFTLVGVKDATGHINLAIYNEIDKTYELYYETKSNTLNLYLKEPEKEFPDYLKTTIEINNQSVSVYKLKEDSRYAICYALDIETGEYNYYSYDTIKETFQIYNDEEINILKEDLKTYTTVLIAFGVGLGCAFILIICLLSSGSKKKKKLKKFYEKELEKKKLEETEPKKKKDKKENKEEVPKEDVKEDTEMYDILETLEKKKKTKK